MWKKTSTMIYIEYKLVLCSNKSPQSQMLQAVVTLSYDKYVSQINSEKEIHFMTNKGTLNINISLTPLRNKK